MLQNFRNMYVGFKMSKCLVPSFLGPVFGWSRMLVSDTSQIHKMMDDRLEILENIDVYSINQLRQIAADLNIRADEGSFESENFERALWSGG